MFTKMKTALRVVLLLCAFADPLRGQETCSASQRVGVLDITGLACEHCSFSRSDEGFTEANFRTEPTIMAVNPDGPSAGILRNGDVLVAIDGDLITTREGRRRFTNLPASGSVTVRVRRQGTLRDIDVPVRAVCRRAPLNTVVQSLVRPPGISVGVSALRRSDSVLVGARPALRALDSARVLATRGVQPLDSVLTSGITTSLARYAVSVGEAARALPIAPVHVGAVSSTGIYSHLDTSPLSLAGSLLAHASTNLRSRARLGFGLRCSRCTFELDSDGKAGSWTFESTPEVYGVVEGSPAFDAGLRSGDVLLRVDDLDIVSEEGAQRLGAIRPGDALVWTVSRGSRTLRFGTVAEERAHPHTTAPLDLLRFSGGLGGTLVEVRGAPVTVTEDLGTGEIVIRSDDLLVRVKVPVRR